MPKQTLNKIWVGETVFIIGGGPSLIGFDFTPIKNRKIIGINNSYRFGSWVDVCWFGDLKWFNWHKKELKTFSGTIAHCNSKSFIKRLKWMIPYERGNPLGIDTRENMVSWNRCSGLSAINLAYHMGASTAVLLGFDMKHNGKQRNWHKDHKEECSLSHSDPMKDCADRRYRHYLSSCKHIKKDADRLKFRIINANPDSAIQEFEKMTLNKFLELENG